MVSLATRTTSVKMLWKGLTTVAEDVVQPYEFVFLSKKLVACVFFVQGLQKIEEWPEFFRIELILATSFFMLPSSSCFPSLLFLHSLSLQWHFLKVFLLDEIMHCSPFLGTSSVCLESKDLASSLDDDELQWVGGCQENLLALAHMLPCRFFACACVACP